VRVERVGLHRRPECYRHPPEPIRGAFEAIPLAADTCLSRISHMRHSDLFRRESHVGTHPLDALSHAVRRFPLRFVEIGD
jgi:hypothetical protein